VRLIYLLLLFPTVCQGYCYDDGNLTICEIEQQLPASEVLVIESDGYYNTPSGNFTEPITIESIDIKDMEGIEYIGLSF